MITFLISVFSLVSGFFSEVFFFKNDLLLGTMAVYEVEQLITVIKGS